MSSEKTTFSPENREALVQLIERIKQVVYGEKKPPYGNGPGYYLGNVLAALDKEKEALGNPLIRDSPEESSRTL